MARVLGRLLPTLCLVAILAAPWIPAEGQNAIAVGQTTFKNVSGAPANDFHAQFQVPTIGLGQDVATATKYGFATGPTPTQNFALAPPIGNNQNFQLTYAPGGIPVLFNNLISGIFTLNGANVATKEVGFFASFLDLFAANTSVRFQNDETANVVLTDLAATTGIPTSFFTFDDFASAAAVGAGTPVSMPTTLTMNGTSTTTLPFAAVQLGSYGLVTGMASLAGDGDTFPFAFAAAVVPEPSALILLSVGLVGLLLGRCLARR